METVYADKLYEFLTEMAEVARSQREQEVARRIDAARYYYMIPRADGGYFRPTLTSEFYGEAMVALEEALQKSKSMFTAEQISLAKEYVDAIKEKWFRP
jgi:hypothetical protein